MFPHVALTTPTMFPVDRKTQGDKKSLGQICIISFDDRMLSHDRWLWFFLGAFRSLPDAAIWWCLRTGGGGVLTSLLPLAIDAPVNVKVLEVIYYHRAIQAYWQSHSERCQYYIKKFLEKSYNTG